MIFFLTCLAGLIFSSNVYGLGDYAAVNTPYYADAETALLNAFAIENSLYENSSVQTQARLVCRNQKNSRIEFKKHYVELNPLRYFDQKKHYSAKVVFYVSCNISPR